MTLFQKIMLVIQCSFIAFLLFYALPNSIKIWRENKKRREEVLKLFKETRETSELLLKVVQGKASPVELEKFNNLETVKNYKAQIDSYQATIH